MAKIKEIRKSYGYKRMNKWTSNSPVNYFSIFLYIRNNLSFIGNQYKR